jgi:YYY domain-containing protein
MFELFQMWALVEILGIVFLPLTVTVFRNVPDRGWAWSKALALLVTSFCVWFPLMVFHALFFNWTFVFSVVLVLLALNVIGFFRTRQTIWQIIRSNGWYVFATEVVFFLMVLLLGVLRSFGPDIVSYERFMDEGFLASIMRSQHFPPTDMWYSGYSINYYYYAHYIVAMLAKLLGQIPSVAFNTGISMLYGLAAVSLFGVTSNIISWSHRYRVQKQATIADIERTEAATPVDQEMVEQLDQTAAAHNEPQEQAALIAVATAEQPIYAEKNALRRGIPFALLTVAMALMLGNMASTVLWLQQHGSFQGSDWFNVTRIIPNTINEFPAFSYLLSDFHAHVLSLPFTILAIGFAFNFLLNQDGKGIFIFGRGWRLWLTLGTAALSMGGLYVMNGWDLPTYFGLVLVAIGIQQWFVHEKRLNFRWLIDTLIAIIPLGALAGLAYSPFLINFVSPSQGIGIVLLSDRTPVGDEVLIYAIFIFVFVSLLFSNILRHLIAPASETKAEAIEIDETYTSEDEAEETEQSKAAFVTKQDNYLSWSFIGILTGLGFVILGLICQFISPNNATLLIALGITVTALVLVLQHINDRGHAFTLFLGALAFALIVGCEVFYLRDVFVATDPRMNTVFKFYFQAWILLSIACSAGLYFILENFQISKFLVAPLGAIRHVFSAGKVVWTICLTLLLLAGCIYPIFAPYTRFETFNPITGQMGLVRTNNLDGMTYLKNVGELTGDYDAIKWLNANVTGTPVIVEAVASDGGDYTNYSRISAFTGLPTIMGWVGHEYQWRVTWLNQSLANSANFNSRSTDVSEIYSDPNNQQVESLFAKYHVEYLYVGALERSTYPKANLNRFSSFMQVVYKAEGVTIYKVRS